MTNVHKLSLMGEALVRATEKIAAAKRTLVPSPIEYDPPIRTPAMASPFEPERPIRAVIKDRLADDLRNFESMSDDELAFEMTTFGTNIENIKIELRLDQEGETQRERGWRVRAERALSIIKGQMNLCRLEIDRRRKWDAEQRKEENKAEMERQRIEKEQRRQVEKEQRQAEMERQRIEKERQQAEKETEKAQRRAAHEKFLQEGKERRQARQQAPEQHARAKAFVHHAERLLPSETVAAIWTAVNEGELFHHGLADHDRELNSASAGDEP